MFNIQKIQELNELEMNVYHYVVQHQETIPYMKIRELASEAHVSTTTVLRFCKKIGCDGYAEFKLKLKQYTGKTTKISMENDFMELKAFIERIETTSFQNRIDEAVSCIAKADRILCIGTSNSGYVAQYAARYFSSFGKFSMAIIDPYYPVNQLGDNLNTVGIIFSISGETEQVIRITNQLKKLNCKIISITANVNNTISQLADINICHYMSICREKLPPAEGPRDFTTQIPAMIIAETLAKGINNRLNEE